MKPPKSIGAVLHGWTYDNHASTSFLFRFNQPCKGCSYGETLPNSSVRCNRIDKCAAIKSYTANKKYERFRNEIT